MGRDRQNANFNQGRGNQSSQQDIDANRRHAHTENDAHDGRHDQE